MHEIFCLIKNTDVINHRNTFIAAIQIFRLSLLTAGNVIFPKSIYSKRFQVDLVQSVQQLNIVNCCMLYNANHFI